MRRWNRPSNWGAIVLILLAFVALSSQQKYSLTPTWVLGDVTTDGGGVFGEKGVASAANRPPGRYSAVGWFDSAHREVWIFGGYGFYDFSNGRLNDLWRFRLNDSTWTWFGGGPNQAGRYNVQGVAAPDNWPGSRVESVACFDPVKQEAWLFGGYGNAASATVGSLNDLWKFQLSNLTWTWISGSNEILQTADYGSQGVALASNMPGARFGATAWFSSPNREFWLFGGSGYSESSSGNLNDLWRYRVGDRTWTWIGGSSSTGQLGTTNWPGARLRSLHWFDPIESELWLFGGQVSTSFAVEPFSDLWRYNMKDGNWTWMAGVDTGKQVAVYDNGTSSTPGARIGSAGWIDPLNRELWLFGGSISSGGTTYHLNDLWRFSLNDNTWQWMAGSNSTNPPGNFGTQGVPDASNIPGGRELPVIVSDAFADQIWFFGGLGYSGANEYYFNDIWCFNNVTRPPAPAQPEPESVAAPVAPPRQGSVQAPTAAQGGLVPTSSAGGVVTSHAVPLVSGVCHSLLVLLFLMMSCAVLFFDF